MVWGVMAYEPYDVPVIDDNDDDMCNAYMVCNAHAVFEDGGMMCYYYMLYDMGQWWWWWPTCYMMYNQNMGNTSSYC